MRRSADRYLISMLRPSMLSEQLETLKEAVEARGPRPQGSRVKRQEAEARNFRGRLSMSGTREQEPCRSQKHEPDRQATSPHRAPLRTSGPALSGSEARKAVNSQGRSRCRRCAFTSGELLDHRGRQPGRKAKCLGDPAQFSRNRNPLSHRVIRPTDGDGKCPVHTTVGVSLSCVNTTRRVWPA